MRKEDLEAAILNASESDKVDYKASFDPDSAAEWIEIIKDIVAIANSGGGAIILGISDDGSRSGFDCASLSALDPAVITDKIFKYTARQFHDFEIIRVSGGYLAILVHGVVVPLVFSKPGTYDIGGGKQKTGFSVGTVYFRHGAKSEPGNSDDLRWFLEQRIEEIRKTWFEGIVKVVEAPPGSRVEVLPIAPSDAPTSIRLVNDPSAPAYSHLSVDETHGFRQKEVVAEINNALKGRKAIRAFEIQCVRKVHKIDEQPTFCYRQKFASNQFSRAFIDWVLAQYEADPDFFEKAKYALNPSKVQVVSATK
jgi:schlafen family protein